jgi:hypothetical protein
MLESFPWPIQLGLVGFFAIAWITTITLHNRSINSGKLIPKATIDAERKAANQKYTDMVIAMAREYANMVVEKDKQLEAGVVVKDEWKEAHKVSERARAEERITTASAVEGSRAIEHFLTSVVPKVEEVPIVGDNGSRGGKQ